MKNILLYIEQAGKGKVPRGWYRKQTINIQRLYYIKRGTGYMIDDEGMKTPFLPQHIYLFPNNYNQEFVTDPDDAIDHIYIDFTTTPPIISGMPLVYPVSPSSALMRSVELLDNLLVERRMDPKHRVEPASFFGQIPEAESGSFEEYKQILYTFCNGLLMLLSYQKEIPFSTDKMLTEVLEYIRTNYATAINIEDLAANHGYNVHHFIRRFRSVMGITPYAYLRHYRLVKASVMIAEGVPLVDVARRVGYESASSLSRALKDVR